MHKLIRIFRILFENLFINYKKYDKNFQIQTTNTVVTFNIRADHPRDNKTNWVYRRKPIIDFIKDKTPGIICMQEVHRHMFMWLYKRLFNTYNFIEISRGKDRSILNTFNWFKDALVIWYDKNEYTLLDHKVINAVGGKALWCKLESKSGIVYNIINTHYSVDNQTNRQNTTNAINLFISENNLTNVYFMGDLNAGMNSTEVKSINLKYRAPFDNETQRTFNHFDETHAIIDFIFSDNIITDYEIVTKNYGVPFISDHYPIITNL
jgi:endonuclease/exonuclease/phosphatase family metal-dependent hydrolase